MSTTVTFVVLKIVVNFLMIWEDDTSVIMWKIIMKNLLHPFELFSNNNVLIFEFGGLMILGGLSGNPEK